MATPLEQLAKLQDQVLETIASFQKPVVEAVGKVADRVEGVVPETPNAPYTDKLPTLDELVESNFAFVEKLLAQQKDFVQALVAAAKPVSDKVVAVETPKSAKAPKAA